MSGPYLLLMIVLSANGPHVVTPIGTHRDGATCQIAATQSQQIATTIPKPSVSFVCVPVGERAR